MYEKKMFLLMIPHILFWRVQTSQSAADIALQCQKELLVTCLTNLIESTALKTVPCSSSFYTGLLTYLNRVVVVKPQEFMQIL
jgi:hypothetical protein